MCGMLGYTGTTIYEESWSSVSIGTSSIYPRQRARGELYLVTSCHAFHAQESPHMPSSVPRNITPLARACRSLLVSIPWVSSSMVAVVAVPTTYLLTFAIPMVPVDMIVATALLD